MTRKAPPQRTVVGLLGLATVIALLIAWRECGKTEGDEMLKAAPDASDVAPAPVPDAILAEIIVPTPNTSWAKLQRTIGGTLGILPSSAGGIVCLVGGLDPLLASELDGVAPAFAVVAGDAGAPHFAFAMKLADLRKSRAALVDGDTARFGSKETGGMTMLVAKSADRQLPVGITLGISPNGYLVLASAEEDLGKLGPYATRVMPKRPLPEGGGAVIADVPQGALGTLVRPRLQGQWDSLKGFLENEDERMRRAHGGRAPDFGDPKAIVTALDGWIGKRIAILADLDHLRAVLDVTDDGVTLLSTLTPRAEGPAAEWTKGMAVGDTAALASLPLNAAVALSVRDGETDRQAQADGTEKLVIDALGPRLPEADRPKVHALAADFTKARGDVLAASLVWDEPQGLALRAPVRDAEAAARAGREGIELLASAPLKEILRAKDVTTKTEDAPNLGKVQVATITREARPVLPGRLARDAGAPPKPDTLGIGWAVENATLDVAAGELPVFTLNGVVRPERKLGDDPAIARTLGALGADANAVLVAQPLRFDPMRANLPPAPFVVALSRKGGDAAIRIEIGAGVIRELARAQLGF